MDYWSFIHCVRLIYIYLFYKTIYRYGPLCNGATTFMFEGVPTLPDPGRYW